MAEEERPTAEQRRFVVALNALSQRHSSSTFGDPGRPIPCKAKRQIAFCYAAWTKWPELGGGDLKTIPVEEWRMSKVDPFCGFWLAGQRQYLTALAAYMDTLQGPSNCALRRDLLADLGFHIVEDFITEEEEAEMMEYWGPGGPTSSFGTVERVSGRRWFTYGPVLPRETQGTTKSTLTVIPAAFGDMPPMVKRQKLRERLRACAERLVNERDCPARDREFEFDQMYVNHYDAASRANIDFHHDNHSCMRGTVGGVSLMSDCILQLRPPPLEQGIRRAPLRISIPRRSVFFMTGLSRWHLQHGIPYIADDRLSLTFRTVDKSCFSRDHSLWDREWCHLEREEATNAVWPLVQPNGAELHLRFPSLKHVVFQAEDGDVRPSSGAALRPTTVAGRPATHPITGAPAALARKLPVGEGEDEEAALARKWGTVHLPDGEARGREPLARAAPDATADAVLAGAGSRAASDVQHEVERCPQEGALSFYPPRVMGAAAVGSARPPVQSFYGGLAVSRVS